jgi:exodeoxyribonuclease VII small subunit
VTEINFEEAIKKLEDEVKRLENGNMSLDESIESFEEAVKLVKICNEKLETAERKVAILTEMSDGTVTDLPFVIDDEA